jgi:tripartite ATP-independent transporter DctP family solute receptor
MKMKKTLIAAVMAVIMLIAACGCEKDPSDEAAVDYSKLPALELIGADSTGKGSAGQVFGMYFAQRVMEITEGRLSVGYHPNGELGGDLDLIRQMQDNKIQIVVCQTAPLVSFVPEMAVFDLPMIFSRFDGDKIDDVLNGRNDFRIRLSNAYEKAGLHLLGFLQNATYRLTTADRDLSSLEDFRGLRIRTMENSNHMAFWTALGANPKPLAWAKVYDELQSGSIEAQENAADTCYGGSMQDVQKYLACTNHILYCNQICISKKAWDSLDPIYQAALEQAAAEAVRYMRPVMADVDTYNKDKLVESGMKLIEYEESFYDRILALDGVKALYDTIDKKQTDGLVTLLIKELNR